MRLEKPTSSTDSTEPTNRPIFECSTAECSIAGVPFDRIAVFSPAAWIRRSTSGTSGKMFKAKYRSINRSRKPACPRVSVSSAKSSASAVTCQKSTWRPCKVRNQVYCNCLSRHRAVNRSALSPNTSRQPVAADPKSKSVPYASKTHARIPTKVAPDISVSSRPAGLAALFALRQPALSAPVEFDVAIAFPACSGNAQIEFLYVLIFAQCRRAAIHHDAAVFEDVAVLGIAQGDIGVLLGDHKRGASTAPSAQEAWAMTTSPTPKGSSCDPGRRRRPMPARPTTRPTSAH